MVAAAHNRISETLCRIAAGFRLELLPAPTCAPFRQPRKSFRRDRHSSSSATLRHAANESLLQTAACSPPPSIQWQLARRAGRGPRTSIQFCRKAVLGAGLLRHRGGLEQKAFRGEKGISPAEENDSRRSPILQLDRAQIGPRVHAATFLS